jgi:hypothetical protein
MTDSKIIRKAVKPNPQGYTHITEEIYWVKKTSSYWANVSASIRREDTLHDGRKTYRYEDDITDSISKNIEVAPRFNKKKLETLTTPQELIEQLLNKMNLELL